MKVMNKQEAARKLIRADKLFCDAYIGDEYGNGMSSVISLSKKERDKKFYLALELIREVKLYVENERKKS